MRKEKVLFSKNHLQEMLDYIEAAPRKDRIDIVRDLLAPRLKILDDDFALEVYDEVIAPVLEEDIRKDIRALTTN